MSFNLGRVLNRFSKDIGFLDDLLPYISCEYLFVSPKIQYNYFYFTTDSIPISYIHKQILKPKLVSTLLAGNNYFCHYKYIQLLSNGNTNH